MAIYFYQKLKNSVPRITTIGNWFVASTSSVYGISCRLYQSKEP